MAKTKKVTAQKVGIPLSIKNNGILRRVTVPIGASLFLSNSNGEMPDEYNAIVQEAEKRGFEAGYDLKGRHAIELQTPDEAAASFGHTWTKVKEFVEAQGATDQNWMLKEIIALIRTSQQESLLSIDTRIHAANAEKIKATTAYDELKQLTR